MRWYEVLTWVLAHWFLLLFTYIFWSNPNLRWAESPSSLKSSVVTLIFWWIEIGVVTLTSIPVQHLLWLMPLTVFVSLIFTLSSLWVVLFWGTIIGTTLYALIPSHEVKLAGNVFVVIELAFTVSVLLIVLSLIILPPMRIARVSYKYYLKKYGVDWKTLPSALIDECAKYAVDTSRASYRGIMKNLIMWRVTIPDWAWLIAEETRRWLNNPEDASFALDSYFRKMFEKYEWKKHI